MAKRATTSSDLPRRRRKASPDVKAAADRAEARAKGKPVTKRTELGARNPQRGKTKSGPGHKTKWTDDVPLKVIECGDKGFSKAQTARELGIGYTTWHRWEKEKPEFRNAIKEAEWLALGHWERAGQMGMYLGSKGFNATAFIFQMKNRFRDTYNDKVDVGLSADSALIKLWEAIGTRKVDGKALGSHDEVSA